MDGGIRPEHRIATYSFTLQEIKNSIPNNLLRDLSRGIFNPDHVVQITKSQLNTSQLVEDALLGPITIPKMARTRVSKKRSDKPSEKFTAAILNYEQAGVATSHTVLGYYFKLYKKLYREEDPDFVGTSTQSAVILVDKMAKEVADKNYVQVIGFVKKIMPLWHGRLTRQEEFPSTRPTVTALFGDKRHFWANRKIYYRRWQNKS